MMTVGWPLIFLRQCQMCVPIHLYGENVEKSFSQNVLKDNGQNLQCMTNVVKLFSYNQNFVPWGLTTSLNGSALLNKIAAMPIYGKNNLHLLKSSSANESMDVWREDNCQKLTKMHISNPKPDLHNINAHTKFGQNPLGVLQVIIRTDGRTAEGRTDRQMDILRETIIPRHYCVEKK